MWDKYHTFSTMPAFFRGGRHSVRMFATSERRAGGSFSTACSCPNMQYSDKPCGVVASVQACDTIESRHRCRWIGCTWCQTHLQDWLLRCHDGNVETAVVSAGDAVWVARQPVYEYLYLARLHGSGIGISCRTHA